MTETPTFSGLGVNDQIVKRLAQQGIETPFDIQTLTIPDALDGRDILGKAKTGSGKTLAFGIPLVQRLDPAHKRTQAVALVPTRELCSQVTEDITSIAPKEIKILATYGGVGLAQHIEQAPKAQVIVATPGRLIDLIERKAADLSKVNMLVIDEADRMADMGFLPQVGKILKRIPRQRQTMLFSATLDSQILGLISQTQDPLRFEVDDPQPTVEGLDHHLFEVNRLEKTDVLVSLLQGPHGLTLVFTRTKRMCDQLARRLKRAGVNAQPIHGDLSQSEREKALNKFSAGTIDVLVATDVAARGLDIEGVELVVNYDPPDDHKSYLHRVGRTARAGRTGTAVTLATWQERGDVERMARMLKLHPHIVEMVSSDPRLQQLGSELVGAARVTDDPGRTATSGVYNRLRRSRGPGRRRR